jgi:hypothetical protein
MICIGALVTLKRVQLVVRWGAAVGGCHGAVVALVQLDVWVAGHGVVGA